MPASPELQAVTQPPPRTTNRSRNTAVLPKPHLLSGIRSVALVVLTVLALGGFAARAEGATVVSLTFDDGRANQTLAGPILQSHGMNGTFYVNSAKLGSSSYYMTWSDVATLAGNGNEVGGHTLDHSDLTAVSTAEATHQICDDRSALTARGYPASSFAYPYGDYDSTIEGIVKSCGYHSARTVWGAGCSGCPTAETIPPPDPYALRAPPSIRDTTTLADLEKYVTNAEAAGGGWLILTFHSICSGCDSYSTSEATLNAFLDWLQPRAATGTTVKTVGAVLDAPTADVTPPVSTIRCNGATCGDWYTKTPVTVTLSATDSQSGVAEIRYTTDGTDPTVAGLPYTGPFTLSTNATVRWMARDNAGNVEPVHAQTVRFDTASPSVALTEPADGASVAGRITLRATASDVDSGVKSVAFYANGSLVGTTTTAPYSATWNPKRRGTYTLQAVATDVAGNTGTSPVRTVTVLR
jgi:peptidoglycan/xylan/chitin deacetylase (PgdA/CDA1 family)